MSRCAAVLASLALAAGLTACGSSSGSGGSSGGGDSQAASANPQTLLHQTFSRTHTVKSGVLRLALVITAKGSSVVTTPITIALSGPFQSRGTGKTPESSFTLGFTGLGRHGSFGVTTTAFGGYINLEGVNYALPQSDVAKLSSSLGGSSGSAPGLSTLGIDPTTWVVDPKVVGTETVDGVTTEHLHAGVDIAALLNSVNTLLAKEASTIKAKAGVSTHLSAAEIAKLKTEIKSPTVDVYTGRDDSILRRLAVAATIPVTGTTSTELGGMTSASMTLTLDYDDLGKPQTIATPSHVRPYSQLQAKLQTLGAGLEGALGSGLSSSSGSSSPGSSSDSSGQVSKYAKCINGASGDVRKMQRCAQYLNSGG